MAFSRDIDEAEVWKLLPVSGPEPQEEPDVA
jgi:hypothetical protein